MVVAVPRFELEFYADLSGDRPVLRWLREELSPTQRPAIGVAMAEILQAEGVGVCRGAYGKQLGDGLFGFRLRHDASEVLRALGKAVPDEPGRERILLRVFCHAHGDHVIMLLGGCDKGADTSAKRQQREIAEAPRRLADYRRRHRGPAACAAPDTEATRRAHRHRPSGDQPDRARPGEPDDRHTRHAHAGPGRGGAARTGCIGPVFLARCGRG